MQDAIARRLNPRRWFGGGRSNLSDRQAAINMSFVLHERSDSLAVRRAVEASRRGATSLMQDAVIVFDGDPSLDVDLWLTASVGCPADLAQVLGTTSIVVVDSGASPRQEVTFFRAPALLTLPSASPVTAGVVALISRPGGASWQLVARGPFLWPAGESTVLRTLEGVIQSHVEQWRPATQLWSDPVEVLLAADFDHDGRSGRGSSEASTTS